MNLQTLLFFIVILPVMFFGLLIALVVNLVDPTGDRFHRMAAWWGRFCARLLGIDIVISGEENYRKDRNYLVISNHAGMADIPLLLGALHLNLRFVAKEELGRIPLFGWALKQAGYVMIKRGQNREALRSLLNAASVLEQGRSVHIFPEGTRSEDGQLLPFKRGAFMIAQNSRTPILPVTIIGSSAIAPKKSLKIRKGQVRMIIGQPIQTAGKKAAELQEETYRTISANLDTYGNAA
ncbi:MAG: lysophospholipid acyltransferase family protein [Prosthecochloris sp.]|uniref:lysophospholipid acyltransferase family protein n=1 Tax=Prosthecochloris sp. ZM_2 TaxID=2045206 RepID=UPI000DF74570|nr:lysophospholipid acyltransferase family protein [Prosthecochloris sp. ZM_2]MEC9486154.1 lysophospholipid acyltransferase family protein [Prosthecochloris sp.]RNA64200.1 1-acyl-sn-glycerol-3-phosphate acyltransferase [Prosthecochloris sp. ZM_2]